jgi:ligand-binding sensor domain-containing protein/signal transduction histidine kinase
MFSSQLSSRARFNPAPADITTSYAAGLRHERPGVSAKGGGWCSFSRGAAKAKKSVASQSSIQITSNGCADRSTSIKVQCILTLFVRERDCPVAMNQLPFARNLFLLLGLILSLLSPSLASAEQLPLRAYTVSDGLAHNNVNRIVLDSRGLLWFCTGDGLSRFDGYAFANFGTDQGLPHPNVTDFLETRDGKFWVATSGGLVLFDPNGAPGSGVDGGKDAVTSRRMFSDTVPGADITKGSDAAAINVLLESRGGEIWCGTNKGLYRLEQRGDSVSLGKVEIGIPSVYREQSFILALVEDHNGSLWAAAPSGLYRRLPDGTTKRYTSKDGLPDEYLHTLLLDDEGRLWAGTRFAGFFQFEPDMPAIGQLRIADAYSPKNGLQTGWVFRLFETSDRRFWAATDRGLIEFYPDGQKRGLRFRNYTTRNGLSYPEITTLAQDLGGNLWLGTVTTGAIKVSRNGFTTYDSGDSIAVINAIFEDRAGGLCFRGSVIGDRRAPTFQEIQGDSPSSRPPVYFTRFGRFDGERFAWFSPDSVPSFGWVSEQVTLQAHSGEWWVGTNDGLYRFPSLASFASLKKARPLAVYTAKDGLAAPQIFRLFEDSHAGVWISTISSSSNGLARWDPGTAALQDLSYALSLPQNISNLAHSFCEDRAGNVWIGFNGAVARYNEGGFKVFSASEGLPPGVIASIYLDHAGRLWLASERSGLIRIDDANGAQPSFRSYTTAQALSSNDTEVITEDRDGQIYIGGGRGLDQLDPTSGRVRHFTTADGLAHGAFLAAFRDHNGELWFGTTGGLSRLRPVPRPETNSPPILISALKAGGSRQMVSALGEQEVALHALAPNQNQVQIDFVGLSFETGDVLGYQYQLEGADAGWGTPTDQRTVTYANLAPGNYKFLVRALNSDGAVSTVPASVAFTVLAPIWRRPWFVALAFASLAILIYSLYRYRVARLLQITNMRTRIATDLHDDIGANLTRIALLSEVAKQQLGQRESKEDGPVSSIGRIARESVGSMSDIVWAIDPDRDSLLDLTRKMRQHADEVFTLRDINLDFTGPDAKDGLRLGIDLRRDLLLIFKEAVNNAARHSECTEVTIDFHIDGPSLLLEIADNGVGFDPSVESDGRGLRSMERRAASLGGTLEISSSLKGTTLVRLRIPMSRARA